MTMADGSPALEDCWAFTFGANAENIDKHKITINANANVPFKLPSPYTLWSKQLPTIEIIHNGFA
jgi:hypothetical protein